jgi:hypothetical protein
VIVVPAVERTTLVQTDLVFYLEPWPGASGETALPLGFAAMYNDAGEPNARVVKIPGTMVMEIIAARDIDEGDEITVPRRETLSG